MPDGAGQPIRRSTFDGGPSTPYERPATTGIPFSKLETNPVLAEYEVHSQERTRIVANLVPKRQDAEDVHLRYRRQSFWSIELSII